MSSTYRIIIRGVRPGQTLDRVAERLAELFKMRVDEVTAILTERAMTIKRGVDLETAAKYQASLEKRGCACLIEPEQGDLVPAAIVTVSSSVSGPPERRPLAAGILAACLCLLAVFIVARIQGL
jgi:hypothetical protein